MIQEGKSDGNGLTGKQTANLWSSVLKSKEEDKKNRDKC